MALGWEEFMCKKIGAESWLANRRPAQGKAWSFAHRRGVKNIPETKEGLGEAGGHRLQEALKYCSEPSPVWWRGKLAHTSDAIGNREKMTGGS